MPALVENLKQFFKNAQLYLIELLAQIELDKQEMLQGKHWRLDLGEIGGCWGDIIRTDDRGITFYRLARSSSSDVKKVTVTDLTPDQLERVRKEFKRWYHAMLSATSNQHLDM